MYVSVVAKQLQCAAEVVKLARLSVSAVAGKQQRQEKIPDFQTRDSDPLNVSDRELGKVYVTPRQTFSGVFSHGLQTPFLKEVQSCGQAGILVRKPALEIINQLKDRNLSDSAPLKFIINGPDGCGKTLTLAHVIHYCHRAKWVLIHVPSVFQWVYSKHEVRHSPHNPQTFDQPHEALGWLKSFRAVNSSYLANLKTSCKYTWGKADVTESDSPLGKIIDQGLQKPAHATDAIGVLLKELAQVTDCKILFAVDEFNGLFGSTSVQDPDKQTVEIQSLNLITHFRKFLSCLPCQSSAVTALSRTGMYHKPYTGFGVRHLLPAMILENIRPYVNVRVEEYTEDEMTTILDYYTSTRWLVSGYDQRRLTEIRFLTARKPSAVQRICATC